LRNRLLSKLRLRHLQALVRLAELGHVGRAAEALNLTQPAVTLLLADLERLLEAPLFLRHARGVKPTALTLDLLPLVRQMLARLDDSSAVVASHREHGNRLVRAAATAAGANGMLAEALAGFGQAHPQIEVVVSNADRAELAATIESEALDVVCCRQPALLPAGWAFRPCLADAFVVVCGPRHPLARAGAPAPEQLAAATWLPNTPGSAAHEQLEKLSQAQGWTPRLCAITTRVTALTWALLDADDLLTLVPLSVVRPWVNRALLHVLPLEQQQLLQPLGLLLPEVGGKPAAALLADHVARHYAT
jgi:DNA-binding transcriptional LysR family regulator